MEIELDFASTLKTYIDAAGTTIPQLEKKTGIPKNTIWNWLQGIVKKPRDWEDLVKIANALELTEDDANQLLSAANHLPISELLKLDLTSEKRPLLEYWRSKPRPDEDVNKITELQPEAPGDGSDEILDKVSDEVSSENTSENEANQRPQSQKPLKQRLIVLAVSVTLLIVGGILYWTAASTLVHWLNKRGTANYHEKNWIEAENYYNLARLLQSDSPQAYYNLGSLYETRADHGLEDRSRAKTAYRQAVAYGSVAAYNNLGRLYVIDEEFEEAVTILNAGLQVGLQNVEDVDIKYDLRKNLGWARLGQERCEEAQAQLQAAIVLSPESAPAYCLLAQVLDKQKNSTAQIITAWEICLRYADPLRPDEDRWIGLARKYLDQQ